MAATCPQFTPRLVFFSFSVGLGLRLSGQGQGPANWNDVLCEPDRFISSEQISAHGVKSWTQ